MFYSSTRPIRVRVEFLSYTGTSLDWSKVVLDRIFSSTFPPVERVLLACVSVRWRFARCYYPCPGSQFAARKHLFHGPRTNLHLAGCERIHRKMYGLDLSLDIQSTIEKTPRKYATLRSNTNRFGTSYKPPETALLPFYNVGRYKSLATAVAKSPRKMSSLRSKVARFPKAKPKNTGASEKVYNTDVLSNASMVTQIANSPRSYNIVRSKRKRFSDNVQRVNSLGPGCYRKAEEVNTSTGRYMSTVGSMLLSPRNYSTFKSRTPRFKGGGFLNQGSSGGGAMWPPMRSRGR